MSVISIIDFNILLIIREISMIDAFYSGGIYHTFTAKNRVSVIDKATG